MLAFQKENQKTAKYHKENQQVTLFKSVSPWPLAEVGPLLEGRSSHDRAQDHSGNAPTSDVPPGRSAVPPGSLRAGMTSPGVARPADPALLMDLLSLSSLSLF